jgi:AcrR family transcriptional regulator
LTASTDDYHVEVPTPTREALIDAATELLDAGGVGGVTLREVGSRAGVSHNAPYKHFAHKEALLAAVAARELEAYGELLAGREGDVRLADAMHAYIARAIAHPERFRLVYGPWPKAPEALAPAAERAWARLTEAVTAEQDRGRLPAGDPAVLADLIRALAHGAIDLELSGHLAKHAERPTTPDDLVAGFLRLLRKASQ